MKKLFGDINISWPKLLIMAIIIGIYAGASLLIPITRDTSFSDLGATFEVWIFFGIFIIMNSKTAKESALKCFIFFLISQPIIYFVQDIVEGTSLFSTYYSTWFIWTLLCIPMGYIGHYMKKNKWWGLLILAPMIVLVGYQYNYYLNKIMFAFPRHLLTVLFCVITIVSYPLVIFEDKKLRIIGEVFSVGVITIFTVLGLSSKPVYVAHVLSNNSEHPFDNTCTVSIEDESLGTIGIEYVESFSDYMVVGNFIKEGNTSFILECPNGSKKTFDIKVKQTTYDVQERKN